MAENGKTIIASIHQPSSQIFQSFDQLILLADGKTVYQGRPSNALNYFATLGYHSPEQYNPADYVMDLINADKKVTEKLKMAYQEKTETSVEVINAISTTTPLETGENRKWPVGFLAQFLALYQRSNKISGKDQFSWLSFIQTFGLAIVCSLVWFRMPFAERTILDRSSFIHFFISYWSFSTLFQGLMSFPFERTVINKERASGSYRLSAYFLAKTCSEAPVKLVLPTLYMIITYWTANINPQFQSFIGFLAVLCVAVLLGESIGMFVGATVQNLKQAFVFVSVWLLGLMLVGGFYIRNLPTWLHWTKWLSYFKYTYDTCLILQFSGPYAYECTDGTLINQCRMEKDNSTTKEFLGGDVLEYFRVDLGIGENFAILIAMIILFRICAYLSLRFVKDKSGRL